MIKYKLLSQVIDLHGSNAGLEEFRNFSERCTDQQCAHSHQLNLGIRLDLDHAQIEDGVTP